MGGAWTDVQPCLDHPARGPAPCTAQNTSFKPRISAPPTWEPLPDPRGPGARLAAPGRPGTALLTPVQACAPCPGPHPAEASG